ncbi:MAG: flagellar hook-basal body complex protein FliE [Nannocystaceae bacterium]|nr:flagellar hook-basal body complex protein FliE [Nannocystaceae bacterium]
MKIEGFGTDVGALPALPTGEGGDADFAGKLESALADLDQTAQGADKTSEGLVTGEVDIHEAMVAMEKADLVLRVAVTARNKVIDAYQQLMQSSGG